MGVSSKNEQIKLRPRITVIGVGGAGNNAVNNMIRSNLEGVEYLVCNTDAQHLTQSLVDPDRRIHLGLEVTQGLGAGSRPEIGRAAAEESLEDVMRHIRGSNMIFITAGMGGGTGTGAAPVIAKAARESGILTVGVITKPFTFEGRHRMRAAENGIKEMTQHVDTLITIPNQNLFIIADESTRLTEAFKVADHVLFSGVRSITDLMIMEGLINLDFADIRSIMTEMGKAMMGTGEASGAGRANAAAEAAISNPLLGDVSIRGARSILINITGGLDITLCEVDEAATRIQDEIDPDRLAEANIIFGSTFDEKMEGTIRVSVIATGIDSDEVKKHQPVNSNVDVGATAEIKDEQKNLSDDLAFEDEKLPLNSNDDFIDPVAGMAEAPTPADNNQENQDVVSEAMDRLTPIHTLRSHNNSDSPEFNRPSNQDSKKGFFSRFIDTIAGRNLDEESQANHTPIKQKAGVKRIRPTSVDDETDMQDVPAYLRRKSK